MADKQILVVLTKSKSNANQVIGRPGMLYKPIVYIVPICIYLHM